MAFDRLRQALGSKTYQDKSVPDIAKREGAGTDGDGDGVGSPAPADGPGPAVMATTINTTKSNTFRAADPAPGGSPSDGDGQAHVYQHNQSDLQRQAVAGSPGSGGMAAGGGGAPAEPPATAVNTSHSNIKNLQAGDAGDATGASEIAIGDPGVNGNIARDFGGKGRPVGQPAGPDPRTHRSIPENSYEGGTAQVGGGVASDQRMPQNPIDGDPVAMKAGTVKFFNDQRTAGEGQAVSGEVPVKIATSCSSTRTA